MIVMRPLSYDIIRKIATSREIATSRDLDECDVSGY